MKSLIVVKGMGIASILMITVGITTACAGGSSGVSASPAEQLKWGQAPFGPMVSPVVGDFLKGSHTTYVKFPAGMTTPIHTHSHAYSGVVISGTTMHWEPGKPETQVSLPAGSHWKVPAGVAHVSECLGVEECIMAISQAEAFDFLPVQGVALDDSAIVAIYNQVNGFDIVIGQLAMEKGSVEEVRALGKMVATDHSAVRQSSMDVAREQKIRPVLPIERTDAAANHQSTYDALSALSGEEFDKAYLLYEIDFHSNAISAVETALLPATSNPALKKLITDVLPGFKHHLAETKRVARKLNYL